MPPDHSSSRTAHARRWGDWSPRAGDVLLSRAPFEISRWMAWNAECPYSHAALMLDDDRFIEAAVPRVRHGRLSRLGRDERMPERLALYRPLTQDGNPLDLPTARRLAHRARRYVGTPFALPRMLDLALQTLARHKLGLRRVRIAEVGPGTMLSCSELVYRVLHEELDLEVPTRMRAPQPRPRLSPVALWREWRAARRRPRRGGIRSATSRLALHHDDAAPLDPHEIITTDLWSSPRLGLIALQVAR